MELQNSRRKKQLLFPSDATLGIDADDDFLYVNFDEGTTYIVDITDPSNPTKAGQLIIAGETPQTYDPETGYFRTNSHYSTPAPLVLDRQGDAVVIRANDVLDGYNAATPDENDIQLRTVDDRYALARWQDTDDNGYISLIDMDQGTVEASKTSSAITAETSISVSNGTAVEIVDKSEFRCFDVTGGGLSELHQQTHPENEKTGVVSDGRYHYISDFDPSYTGEYIQEHTLLRWDSQNPGEPPEEAFEILGPVAAVDPVTGDIVTLQRGGEDGGVRYGVRYDDEGTAKGAIEEGTRGAIPAALVNGVGYIRDGSSDPPSLIVSERTKVTGEAVAVGDWIEETEYRYTEVTDIKHSHLYVEQRYKEDDNLGDYSGELFSKGRWRSIADYLEDGAIKL